MPTRPTSAINFSSSRTVRISPGSPGVDCRGARLVAVLKRLLPLPPLPPRATTTWSPSLARSFNTWPCSASMITVPGGTAIVKSLPEAPWQLAPLPCCARLGLPRLAMGEHGEAIDAFAGDQDHAAAVAAVAAVGSAQRHILFPPEADATVTPLARLETNDHFIDKHGLLAVKFTSNRGKGEGGGEKGRRGSRVGPDRVASAGPPICGCRVGDHAARARGPP